MRRTRSQDHTNQYKEIRNTLNQELWKAKREWISSRLQSAGTNMKDVFRILSSVTQTKSRNTMPDSPNDGSTANDFSTFFDEKIYKIRESIKATRSSISVQNVEPSTDECPALMREFKHTNNDEIQNVISCAPNKTCDLDIIPTFLLKEKAIQNALLPSITELINKSLSSGVVPSDFKKAIVYPLLKKPGLDHNQLQNYRPVSNLSFLSKCLEKIVSVRLIEHLKATNSQDKFQSAYKAGHSTETALLKIKNDVCIAMDEGKVTLLVMLDLSAAFDTIDHNLLLKRLLLLGFDGTVTHWIQSYLNHRTQMVKINNQFSQPSQPLCGVPQGSVLGPLLFSIYILPISKIAASHNINYHVYADDTQLYTTCKISDIPESCKKLEQCIHDIRSWMTSHFLKMNDDKTEFIIFSSCPSTVPQCSINICGTMVYPSTRVKNLGVLFDNKMDMSLYVNTILKSGYFHLRNISRVRRLLDKDSTNTLVRTTVLSRLDYCNSLLFGMSNQTIKKLQVLQNSSARLITLTSRFENISPTLISLHWLPVTQRIEYKIIITTFKALKNGPCYLNELLTRQTSERTTRQSTKFRLQPPKTRTKRAQRAFSVSAPLLLNGAKELVDFTISDDTFRTKLKTFLFKKAYYQHQ